MADIKAKKGEVKAVKPARDQPVHVRSERKLASIREFVNKDPLLRG